MMTHKAGIGELTEGPGGAYQWQFGATDPRLWRWFGGIL